jgi:hypothetical protein
VEIDPLRRRAAAAHGSVCIVRGALWREPLARLDNKEDVVWLDVAVYEPLRVDICQPACGVRQRLPDGLLAEATGARGTEQQRAQRAGAEVRKGA